MQGLEFALYARHRLEEFEGHSPQAVIRDWSSPLGQGDPVDAFSVSTVVGRSLAAESAMRLAAAISARSADRLRVVAQACDEDPTMNLIVEI